MNSNYVPVGWEMEWEKYPPTFENIQQSLKNNVTMLYYLTNSKSGKTF